MSTVTLHKDKLAKAVLHEEKILDFILYNRVLCNVVTNNEIIYKLWSIDERYQEKMIEYTSKVMMSFYTSIFSYI